jgi:hypothetical protein
MAKLAFFISYLSFRTFNLRNLEWIPPKFYIENFSVLHSVQIVSEAHSAYYLMGIADPFPQG